MQNLPILKDQCADAFLKLTPYFLNLPFRFNVYDHVANNCKTLSTGIQEIIISYIWEHDSSAKAVGRTAKNGLQRKYD